MYEKIKRWYIMGLWTQLQVMHALEKHVITEAEASSILGGDL